MENVFICIVGKCLINSYATWWPLLHDILTSNLYLAQQEFIRWILPKMIGNQRAPTISGKLVLYAYKPFQATVGWVWKHEVPLVKNMWNYKYLIRKLSQNR